MEKKDIVILGASGFAKEIVWLLEENNKICNEWNIMGYIDKTYSEETHIINGYRIIGNDEWLINYKKPINVVCGIANSNIREQIIKKFQANHNINYPNIISNRAAVSERVIMGKGCIICVGSIVSVDTKLGDFVTVNYGCTIGHDTILNDYVTLYPSVNVSGNVIINNVTEIGTGTQIIQGIIIGHNTIIGAGAVVIKDITSCCTAVGVPAKIIKQR